MTYPQFGYDNFKCTLRTFKQQLTLKMRVRCGISIVLFNVPVLAIPGYDNLMECSDS